MEPSPHTAHNLWFDQLGPVTPRDAVSADGDYDVVIIGGGYTGLWTAYYLLRAAPELRVALVEAQICGFGASGRNGGWCSALFPRSADSLAATHGAAQAIAMRSAMVDTVAEVGRVVSEEAIACDFVLGGTLEFARSSVQLQAAGAEAESAASFGVDHPRLLTADENRRYGVSHLAGTLFEPACARIQPAKLVRGLAEVVQRRGAHIFENSPVVSWGTGFVRTDAGHTLRAGTIVLAVEGWRSELDSKFEGTTRPRSLPKRSTLPLYSSMIATEPLDERIWQQIGIEQGQTFADFRHLLIYGQRTADNRIAFGGRGAKYHWGSRISPDYDYNTTISTHLEATLHEMFPVLAAAQPRITHRWGGPLGVPRDWHASVGLDAESHIAWAGGYVGDGVSTTNLAGRTLAHLITGTESALTRLPWVNHPLRSWEPEPLRFLGTNAGLIAMDVADTEERLRAKPSLVARLMGPLIGG